jgi:hypothetical protein
MNPRPPTNPLIQRFRALLTGMWSFLKGKFHVDFSKLGTYIQIALFLIIFILLITTSKQYREVKGLTKEIVHYRDSIRYHDVARDQRIAEINQQIKEMQEISFERDKEFLSLQKDLNELRLSKAGALQEIDKFSNKDLANFFQGKSLKPAKK